MTAEEYEKDLLDSIDKCGMRQEIATQHKQRMRAAFQKGTQAAIDEEIARWWKEIDEEIAT